MRKMIFDLLDSAMARFNWTAHDTAVFAGMAAIGLTLAVTLILIAADFRHSSNLKKYGMREVLMAEKATHILNRYDFKFAVFSILLGTVVSIGGVLIGAWFVKVTQPDWWEAVMRLRLWM
jgi:hypothetical protein